MKTSTKVLAAAAAGYALRAYVKRDTIKTNEALRHSVDRRLSVEGTPAAPPTFVEHMNEWLGRKIGTKTSEFLYGKPYTQTRYGNFGRKGQN